MPIPPISITSFTGETPILDTRLLADNAASESINAWLFSGRIEPIHSLQPLHVMGHGQYRSWFRLPKNNPGVDNMIDSYWLEFENENVRVIRSPAIGQDDDGRFYWADGLYPKYLTGEMIRMMNAVPKGAWSAATNYAVNDGVTFSGVSYTAIAAGINHQPSTSPTFWSVTPTPLKLGVPAPTTAPAVAIGGGVSTSNKTVTYVYTWVTEFGEEGPPSPPTTVIGKIDATYTVTVTAPLPADTTGRKLAFTRIYRTVVSTQGVGVFYFVVEIPITALAWSDNAGVVTDAVIVQNEQLPSLTWSGPPADLQGLVVMGNGMVVGWRFNEVWFCEPYHPHAWPIQFVIAVDADIIGLGVHEQSVIILTSGQPYAASGVVPEAMSLTKIQPLEPCTSRRSIVNTPEGVLFCSPNGLINVTARGAQNLTRDLILKDQWSARLNLPSVVATTLASGYYCFSGPGEGVFQVDFAGLEGDRFDTFQHDDPATAPPTVAAFQTTSGFGTLSGMFLHKQAGLTVLDPDPSEVFNLIQDLYNGETMQLRDGIIYLVDIRQLAPYAKYRWKSKVFTLPYLQNLGAAKVYWTPAPTGSGTSTNWFRVYASDHATLTDDGLPLKFQQEMTKSGQMFRLPSGYKAQYYQFEVEGYLVVDAIHAAQTARELRKI